MGPGPRLSSESKSVEGRARDFTATHWAGVGCKIRVRAVTARRQVAIYVRVVDPIQSRHIGSRESHNVTRARVGAQVYHSKVRVDLHCLEVILPQIGNCSGVLGESCEVDTDNDAWRLRRADKQEGRRGIVINGHGLDKLRSGNSQVVRVGESGQVDLCNVRGAGVRPVGFKCAQKNGFCLFKVKVY